MDKLLKDKRLATIDDLFSGDKLKLDVQYWVNLGEKTTDDRTRARVLPSKYWAGGVGNWMQKTTNGESLAEYENYKYFLRSYIRSGFIYI